MSDDMTRATALEMQQRKHRPAWINQRLDHFHSLPSKTGLDWLLNKRWLCLFYVVAATSGLSGTSVAQEGNRDFTLFNKTRYDIAKVQVAARSDTTWTEIRRSPVASGAHVKFEFDNVGQCTLDLRIDFVNGNHADFMNGFNFCGLDSITVTYNGSTNTFTATADK